MVEPSKATAARGYLRDVSEDQAPVAPQNPEAKSQLVGGLLLAGESGPEVSARVIDRVRATGLQENHFYRPSLGRIYRAIVAVAERHEPPTGLLVADELRRRGELTELGGDARLVELGYAAPAYSNVDHYARLVKDTADRRAQWRVAHALKRDAEAGIGLLENPDLHDQVKALLNQPLGDTLKPLPLADMLAEPLPPIDWLCKPLIERGTVGVIAGDGYVGKSLLALDLLLALRRGVPFLGFETTPARVGYIDAENGEREVNRRLRKLGLTADDLNGLFYSKDRLSLGTPAGVAQLRATIEAEQLDVVVLDSIRRLAPNLEENDSAAVAWFFDPLLALRDELGTTILPIHHTRKENQAKPSDAGQMIRGSSDFRNAADLVLFVRAKRGDKHRLIVEQDKIRSGIRLDPFVVYRDNRGDGTVRHVYEGPADAGLLGADHATLQNIIRELEKEPGSTLTRTQLALRIGTDPKNSSYSRALAIGWETDQLSRAREATNKPVIVGLGPASFQAPDNENSA
jgi:hypothetical protein